MQMYHFNAVLPSLGTSRYMYSTLRILVNDRVGCRNLEYEVYTLGKLPWLINSGLI